MRKFLKLVFGILNLFFFVACSNNNDEINEDNLSTFLYRDKGVLVGLNPEDNISLIKENNNDFLLIIEGTENISLWKEFNEKGIDRIDIIFKCNNDKIESYTFEFTPHSIEGVDLMRSISKSMVSHYNSKFEAIDENNWNFQVNEKDYIINIEIYDQYLKSSIIPK